MNIREVLLSRRELVQKIPRHSSQTEKDQNTNHITELQFNRKEYFTPLQIEHFQRLTILLIKRAAIACTDFLHHENRNYILKSRRLEESTNFSRFGPEF